MRGAFRGLSRHAAVILALKALHLAALLVWCAGLLALPLTLRWHDPDHSPGTQGRLLQITRGTYIWLATPAAVIAIGSGTGLMFAREVFVPWMFAKLLFVAVMVVVHVRVGLAVEKFKETPDKTPAPGAVWLALAAAATISGVLLLVLSKPAPPANLAPTWLSSPRDQPLPLAEPPIR